MKKPAYLCSGLLFFLFGLFAACTPAPVSTAIDGPLPTPSGTAHTGAQTLVPNSPPTSPTTTEANAQLADWWAYRNESFGFSLVLPPEAEVTAEQENYTRIDLPVEPDTNLSEKYLEITILGGVDPCASLLAQGYEPGAIPKEPVEINGTEFIRERGSEGAAGNFYDFVAYSVEKGEACISLGFVLHSSNADNFENPPPTYVPAEEAAVFEQIMNTFQLDE